MANIQVISSFAIFFPLVLAGSKFKTGDIKLRLFFVFLLIGTMVDFFGWMNFNTGFKIGFLTAAVLFYSFVEAVFFTWISTIFLDRLIAWRIRLFLGSLIGLLFISRLFLIYRDSPNFILSPIVESFYLVTTAFLAGFSLLKIAEKTDGILRESWFWVLSGIFFYSFGTFFIDTLRGTSILNLVWPVRNVINIIQYGFFVIGLILVPVRKSQ